MDKNTGSGFTLAIVDAEEMINQIELFLKERKQNVLLLMNGITIHFDEYKYKMYDYEEEKLYEFSFLKNNDMSAYFEVSDKCKIECHLLNGVLYGVKIPGLGEID
jgi:hypothetical protein